MIRLAVVFLGSFVFGLAVAFAVGAIMVIDELWFVRAIPCYLQALIRAYLSDGFVCLAPA